MEPVQPSPATPQIPAALLEIHSLRGHFEKLFAVNEVSVALHGGTLLGLIGPNGAGKTTLLRAAAGLQPPTRGVIRVHGERVEPNNADVMRSIGFTPDTPPVYEDLTVRQFLTFIAKGY